jgi:hypothetical protein
MPVRGIWSKKLRGIFSRRSVKPVCGQIFQQQKKFLTGMKLFSAIGYDVFAGRWTAKHACSHPSVDLLRDRLVVPGPNRAEIRTAHVGTL